MNRIVARFARLKGEKGFIVYLGAGDSNLEATGQLALAFDKLLESSSDLMPGGFQGGFDGKLAISPDRG